ncbi:HEAT repeat domain-containing protein [Gemmata sp.]|uniref:HEAT repeat domain-containing protein n=1 Tax=Gemmata sp. TaxID=1914242 RepID=UPI003F726525
MFTRPLAGLALAAALAVTVSGQERVAGLQPDPKETKSPGPTKLPELKWPTEIGGKDAKSWLKDLSDPDAAIRQAALNTITGFGPELRKDKAVGKALLARLRVEPDPGVKAVLFDTVALIGFEDPGDETEAIRLLAGVIDSQLTSSVGRRHAVQAVAAFGPKAEKEVKRVAGYSLNDPSFETRQVIARCLGQIGFNKSVGPNYLALQALATLARDGSGAKDGSVAVRMDALQALVLLGPPWEGARKDDKTPPKINQKSADFVADVMRARLGKGKTKDVEPDKQLEIWCRVVLMRFDPKEINDENLTAIARHCEAKDDGPKVQALQALAIFGEQAGAKVDAVVGVLQDDNPLVLNTALTALASMGVKGAGAIEHLEKVEKKWEKLRQERLIENLKDKTFSEAYDKLSAKEKEQVVASMPQEQVRLTVANTIKWIKNSKPGVPGGEQPAPDKAP